jgi:hypothetical protein
MVMWIETKYINLLSVQLEQFKVKQTNPYIANFRCPICHDSQKNKLKARGYIYSKGSGLFYKCHNCGIGTSLGKLIESLNNNLYKQYKMERYSEGLDIGNSAKPHAKVEFNFEPMRFGEKNLLDRLLDRLDVLPDSNPAVRYCLSRKIPRSKFNELYYIDDIKKVENLSEKLRGKIVGTEPRLVIPFYNRQSKLVGITCRALGDEKLRYIAIPIDKTYPMIYNLDRVDTSRTVYCTEGPIDSLFLPNAIAVGSTDLKKIEGVIPKQNAVLIFDNQPRNPEVVKIIRAAASNHWRMVVWPEHINQKDINEMIIAGMSQEELMAVINKNTVSGLALRLRLNAWSKCS